MGSLFGIRVVMLMLLLLFLTMECDAASRKKHVRVTNELGGGLTLKVHCKSEDDDIGLQVLPPNGFFEFSFSSGLFEITDFYCSFQWPGGFKWYDIYEDGKDYRECDKCWWVVRTTEYGPQPCRLNLSTGKYDICKPWNPKWAMSFY